MRVEIKQITCPNLFRECAEMTTGKECKMSWNRALCSGHSIIRAEEYLIKLYDIPQCVANHLVRHIHAQPYVLSKRPDRGGLDFRDMCGTITKDIYDVADGVTTDRNEILGIARAVEELPLHFDRYAPTNMALKLNAEEIINISKVRLCSKASGETQKVWKSVIDKIREIDPDLANHCQPTCIYRGGICPEPKSCGFNKTDLFQKQLNQYKLLFV